MAATFTTAGHTALRQYIIDNYKNIGVFNGGGTEIARLTSTKTSWVNINGDGDNFIAIEAVLKGDGTTDAAIVVGTVIGGVKLFPTANTTIGTGASMVDVTYDTAFTFQNNADQLTVQIKVTIPGV